MDLPETLRKRLEDFSRNVLFDQSRTQPLTKENDPFSPHDKRVLSSLHLQMSLYFNMWFFPLWWISETTMLHLKYPALPDYYKFILVTVLIVMTLIEAIRLFLGYTGNLQEKVTHHSHKHKDITTYTNVRGRGFLTPVTSVFLGGEVPELAGFWLLSILLQFPLILFQLFNEAILILPLERGVHIVLAIFILTQALSGFVALRDMVKHTESQFHLRQFD
ncbi:transmembrane protein 17B isoform X1 [Dicentrarchus labrax]|uniref:transmembrane protein 17B isoform X1 n=1 Tax=Dicentrarchus labrax TaxID=13489 RepID=UPI0021F64066|nr:transmembrane protein 17B isoform X1 [Dicentrarchus labrax]